MSEQHPFRESAPVPGEHVLDLACRALDLSAPVERRKKILVEEILGLCRKYGFSHPKELDLTSKIPLKDLETIELLLKKLEHIVIHHELPEGERELLDDKEYTIEIPPGAAVTEVIDDHGRPVMVGHQDGGGFLKDALGHERHMRDEGLKLARVQGHAVVIEKDQDIYHVRQLDGQPVRGLQETYKSVSVDDNREIKSVFVGASGQGARLIVLGEPIGRPEGYHSTFTLVTIADHSYFFAQEHWFDKECIYTETGEKFETNMSFPVISLLNVDEELVLLVKQGERQFFVHTDGSLLEGERKEGFEDAHFVKVFDGEIYFFENTPTGRAFRCHTEEKPLGFFDSRFAPHTYTKIGEDFFFLRKNICYHLSQDGSIEKWKDTSVLPIRVGESLVKERGKKLFVDDKEVATELFYYVYVLEPLDERRFYVIAWQEGKIVKRVFTI